MPSHNDLAHIIAHIERIERQAYDRGHAAGRQCKSREQRAQRTKLQCTCQATDAALTEADLQRAYSRGYNAGRRYGSFD